MPSCPICNKIISLSNNDFQTHVQNCGTTGECPICKQKFLMTEIEVHIDSHLAQDAAAATGAPAPTSTTVNNNGNPTNNANNNDNNSSNKKKCPMCNKTVPINELDAHVNEHFESGDVESMQWQASSGANSNNNDDNSNNNVNNNNNNRPAPPLPDGATFARTNLSQQTGDWKCPFCTVLIPIELRELHLKAHNKRPESMSRESSQAQSAAPTPNHPRSSNTFAGGANQNTNSSQNTSGTFTNGGTASSSSPHSRTNLARNNNNNNNDIEIMIQCPLCKKIIPEKLLQDHMTIHDFRGDGKSSDSAINLDDDDAKAHQQATKACPLCFKQVKEALYAWHVQSCGVESTIECKVCWDDVPIEEAFSFTCPGSHKVCRECAGRLLEVSINDHSIAACPVGDCRKPVSSLDVAAFFGGPNSEMAKKYAQIELKSALESTGAIMTCGTVNCPNQVLLDDAAKHIPTCFRCNSCRSSTCTLCRSQPFHFRLSCEESRRVQANWLGVLADIVGSSSSANGAANTNLAIELREKMDRYKELQEDEKLKERTCRLCTHCGRVIEKIEGCDSMRCGRDAHGSGNVQDGCGASLNWAKMKPYKARLPDPPKNDKVKKELMSRAVHSEFDRCTMCHDQIAGPRFLCANCPEEVSFCLKCIPKYGETAHARHFFQVIVAD